jgi:sporulation related protein
MADDQFQRPYRASEPPVRGVAKTPGSDPLAELARLIGQTDPFGEFGREPPHRAPASQPGEHSDWNAPAGTPYTTEAGVNHPPVPPQRFGGNGYYTARSAPGDRPVDAVQDYHGQSYGRASYGGTPSTIDDELYQADHEARGYPLNQADYQHDAYVQDTAHHAEEEYYDDAPTSRRRLGVMAIAGVLALAVIGTAGAFGYRALFRSTGSPQPPPVIKADTGPSKIVPATTGKDAQSNKLITDRMNERGQSEKLVSREEQPLDKPTTVVLSQPAPQSELGSGVIGSEPKKVRTIAIHPDQPVGADATPQGAAPLAAVAPARAATPAARPSTPPARATDTPTAEVEQDAAPPPTARAAAPVRSSAPPPNGAPLSLSPDAAPLRAAERAPAAAPSRTASVAAPAPVAPAPSAAAGNAGGPGSYVQVSSQRSEAEAQAAFRSLQAKYPNQLGGRQPLIHRVDLGAKGTYYRTMVGPFANAGEAGELCASLKAAGGQCLIQRN